MSNNDSSFDKQVEANINEWEQDIETFISNASEKDIADKDLEKTAIKSAELKEYLDSISHIPFLTFEEQLALSERIKNHDREAINALVQTHLRLVVSIAKNYTNRGMDIMDLIGEGNLGLIHAAEKYDASHKCRFDTYATYWIRSYIGRALNEQAQLIRLPPHARRLFVKIYNFRLKFIQKHNREATVTEISEQLQVPEKKIITILNATQDILAYDQPLYLNDENGKTLLDSTQIPTERVYDPTTIAIDRQRYDTIVDLLHQNCANEKEFRIMLLRYGFADGKNRSLMDLSEEFSMSREGIRRIELKMKEKMSSPECYEIIKKL